MKYNLIIYCIILDAVLQTAVFQLFISNETNQKAATLIGTLRKMSPSTGSL